MIASLKMETMGKLINRIPVLFLLISNLPGLALRMMVNQLASLAMSTSILKAFSAILAMSTSILKALPGRLDIKRHSPSILYGPKASQCQQEFSKPCLVNLISKDTHLVISIFVLNEDNQLVALL